MPSTTHILETALLLLVAFLIGATLGYLARRLTAPKQKAESKVAVPHARPTGPQLVVAPTIAPVAGTVPRRTAAERLAAAANRDAAESVAPPPTVLPAPAAAQDSAPPTVPPLLQPSRTAGEATSGIVVPSPSSLVASPPAEPPADTFDVPPVESEPAAAPVLAEDVPQIDEAAHVVDPPSGGLEPETPAEPAETPRPAVHEWAEAEPPDAQSASSAPPEVPETLTEPPPVASAPSARTALEDDEFAAMRAIESGSWTPRPAAPSRPVPHPENARAPEVDAAMANARSAVASATAAAAAAIEESARGARERQAAAAEILAAAPPVSPVQPESPVPPETPAPLAFEPAFEATPQAFLESELAAAPAHIEVSGLSFENQPRFAFGKPDGLPEPRDGQPDNLKQIRGVTPQLESSLNRLGIYHFDQIAAWDQKAVVWLDNHLALKGSIVRDKWLEQARALGQGRGRPIRPVRR